VAVRPWLASMKLCFPALAISLVPPTVYLLYIVASVLWKALLGYQISWSPTLENVASMTLRFLSVGLFLAVVAFVVLVPITRYEIWKNNKVEPRK
jgi:hypothetical protein